MNIEIIKSLKERAKEMLEDNYDRKIGDEEIYTIICELENFYTAYEKEKEKIKTFKIEDENIYLQYGEITEKKRWKDKIKAKMKEKEWALENYDCDEADYKQSQAIGAWSVLQSLLEKE